VLNNGGLLGEVRDPRFLNVCRELEEIKNGRVVVVETHPLLTPWLCYHARHNDVYFDGRLIGDSPVPRLAPFSKVPDLKDVDFVATCDRIVDLRAPLVDDTPGGARSDGHLRYWLGPPAGLRFLALWPISANLKCDLRPDRKQQLFPSIISWLPPL
jgi:hypothetical protein